MLSLLYEFVYHALILDRKKRTKKKKRAGFQMNPSRFNCKVILEFPVLRFSTFGNSSLVIISSFLVKKKKNTFVSSHVQLAPFGDEVNLF